MTEPLTLGVWLYGFAGLGFGVLLSQIGRWLLQTHYRSSDEAFDVQHSPFNVQRLDIWLTLVTGAGFTALWLLNGSSLQTLISSVYAGVLLLVFALDIAHRWVPNAVVLPATILALGISLLTGHPSPVSAVLGGITGFIWFYLIAVAYRGALGAGDVKLAGLIGVITGFPDVLTALTIGILLGGIMAALLLISRRKTRKCYIPYAPFLVTGALVTLVHGTQIASRFTSLSGW